MNVLIIKHVDIEGPGLIEYCLAHEKISYRVLNLKPKDRNLYEKGNEILKGLFRKIKIPPRPPFLKGGWGD
jgi:hypothetical protein